MIETFFSHLSKELYCCFVLLVEGCSNYDGMEVHLVNKRGGRLSSCHDSCSDNYVTVEENAHDNVSTWIMRAKNGK